MDNHPDDIIVWPDDVWCYRYELKGMLSGRSDDYYVVRNGTNEHYLFECSTEDNNTPDVPRGTS